MFELILPRTWLSVVTHEQMIVSRWIQKKGWVCPVVKQMTACGRKMKVLLRNRTDQTNPEHLSKDRRDLLRVSLFCIYLYVSILLFVPNTPSTSSLSVSLLLGPAYNAGLMSYFLSCLSCVKVLGSLDVYIHIHHAAVSGRRLIGPEFILTTNYLFC